MDSAASLGEQTGGFNFDNCVRCVADAGRGAGGLAGGWAIRRPILGRSPPGGGSSLCLCPSQLCVCWGEGDGGGFPPPEAEASRFLDTCRRLLLRGGATCSGHRPSQRLHG
eukprot:SAG22_NODE_1252_length_5005_cov_1.761313_3_plen_111_part_00